MNSSRHTQTRRQFLGVTGITTGALLVGFPAILRVRSPNDKLNIAIIGCGGRGAGNLAEVSTENIVAYRVGKKLLWDHVKVKARNAPDAAHMIRRKYRQGWKLV